MKKNKMNQNVENSKRSVPGKDYRDLGAVLLFIFLLPYVISFFFGNASLKNEGEAEENKVDITMQKMQEEQDAGNLVVYNTTAAGTEKMPVETYLICRLPATISIEYSPETLKAQAVVLRTQLLSNVSEDKKSIYTEGELCTTDGEEYKKCADAVQQTRGMFLSYNGKPVKAPYFAVSAGSTRNGNEVFESEDYPYLKSVKCGRDPTAPGYADTVRVDSRDFAEKLKECCPELEIQETDIPGEIELVKDKAEYVILVKIKNSVIPGEVFRKKFSLNSSAFSIEQNQRIIELKTNGIGHGLGFDQFAAEQAAKKGSDYIDLLNYFFSDIELEKTE